MRGRKAGPPLALTPEDLKQELARRVGEPRPFFENSLALPGDYLERRLLVALAAHTRRQRWVTRVVEERLGADLGALAEQGYGGHPRHRPDRGVVPGLPGWSYDFHGRGCCLTHENGAELDVDFDLQGGDRVDQYFFARYLGSLRVPRGVDALLVRPPPFSRAWMADVDGLFEQGCVDGTHWFRLTDQGKTCADALEPALEKMTSATGARRRQLALLLQDFEEASTPGGEPLPAGWSDQHRAFVDARATRLERRIREGRGHALAALAWLDPARAHAQVRRLLARPEMDGLTSESLGLVEHWKTPDFEPILLEVAARAASPETPMPFVRVHALALVLSNHQDEALPEGLRRPLLGLVRANGHASEGGIAFLHFILDPADGRRRLGRALQHPVPMARQEAAALLALVGIREANSMLRGKTPAHFPSFLVDEVVSLQGLLEPLLCQGWPR